jgi:hypothetical protein
MLRYKIIHKSNIIDVVQNPTFVKFLPSGNVAITDKFSATGMAGSDGITLYSFIPTTNLDVKNVKIEEISEEEFSRLYNLLNSDQELIASRSLLVDVQNKVIQNLSETCKAKITAGFSIVLSDNKVYTFRLSAEDQLNLLNFENQIAAGRQNFIYHAVGESCKVFGREDMQKIIQMYRKHILYHTTYFNVAKQYINSLTDIDSINTFTYGMDVINATEDNIIRQILRSGGNGI